MKSIITTLVMGLLTISVAAQPQVEEIHDHLADADGCISLSLNEGLDGILGSDFDITEHGINIAGEISRTRISLLDLDIDEENDYYYRILGTLNRSGLKRLNLENDDEDGDAEATLWLERTGAPIQEMHLFVSDEDDGLVFITLKGNFTVTEE